MNAWLPQASYPCGNFSDTSCITSGYSKGSIGRAFAVFIHTENQNQASFCPFTLRKVSVHAELTLGHLRYRLTDVPPQSNSPPDNVLGAGRPGREVPGLRARRKTLAGPSPSHRVSKETMKVVVFQRRDCSLPLMLHLSCLSTKSD